MAVESNSLDLAALASPALELFADLRAGLKKRYSKKREGIHISDLSQCHRQIVFRDLNPNLPLTNEELNFFTSGKAIGEALESTVDQDKVKYGTESFTHIGHFIMGHMDIFDQAHNMPIEFKTYRSSNSEKLPKVGQVEQLKSYMAGRNADVGLLVYQLLMKFSNSDMPRISLMNDGTVKVELDPFVVYVFRMNQEQRDAWTRKSIEEGLSLARARAYGQPAMASFVMFDKDKKWMCGKCPFKKPCLELVKGAQQGIELG